MDAHALIKKGMDRSIAIVLSFKDEECDQYLPTEISGQLRGMILEEFNKLRELACGLIGSDDSVNEYYVQILAKLNDLEEALFED